jgi:hypothetical protein
LAAARDQSLCQRPDVGTRNGEGEQQFEQGNVGCGGRIAGDEAVLEPLDALIIRIFNRESSSMRQSALL